MQKKETISMLASILQSHASTIAEEAQERLIRDDDEALFLVHVALWDLGRVFRLYTEEKEKEELVNGALRLQAAVDSILEDTGKLEAFSNRVALGDGLLSKYRESIKPHDESDV